MGGEERIKQGRVWETLKFTAIDGGKRWPLMEEHSVVGLEGAGKNLAPTLQSPAKASHWLNLGVRPSEGVGGPARDRHSGQLPRVRARAR